MGSVQDKSRKMGWPVLANNGTKQQSPSFVFWTPILPCRISYGNAREVFYFFANDLNASFVRRVEFQHAGFEQFRPWKGSLIEVVRKRSSKENDVYVAVRGVQMLRNGSFVDTAYILTNFSRNCYWPPTHITPERAQESLRFYLYLGARKIANGEAIGWSGIAVSELYFASGYGKKRIGVATQSSLSVRCEILSFSLIL